MKPPLNSYSNRAVKSIKRSYCRITVHFTIRKAKVIIILLINYSVDIRRSKTKSCAAGICPSFPRTKPFYRCSFFFALSFYVRHEQDVRHAVGRYRLCSADYPWGTRKFFVFFFPCPRPNRPKSTTRRLMELKLYIVTHE